MKALCAVAHPAKLPCLGDTPPFRFLPRRRLPHRRSGWVATSGDERAVARFLASPGSGFGSLDASPMATLASQAPSQPVFFAAMSPSIPPVAQCPKETTCVFYPNNPNNPCKWQ